MAGIFVLSSISHPPAVPEGVDKNLHAALYAGLTALVVRALAGGWRRHVSLSVALVSIVIATAYGVTDEFHQSLVPLRKADAMDVVADAIGATAAAVGLYGWDIIRGRHGL